MTTNEMITELTQTVKHLQNDVEILKKAGMSMFQISRFFVKNGLELSKNALSLGTS